MNEKPKETRARVYLRRAVLAALDAAIVAFSFYFALLLRADGAPVQRLGVLAASRSGARPGRLSLTFSCVAVSTDCT